MIYIQYRKKKLTITKKLRQIKLLEKFWTPTIKEERPTGLKSRIFLFPTTRVFLVTDAAKLPHRRLQSDILTITVHD